MQGIVNNATDHAVQSVTSQATGFFWSIFSPWWLGLAVAFLLLVMALVGTTFGAPFKRVFVLAGLSLGVGYVSWIMLPARPAPAVVAEEPPAPRRPWRAINISPPNIDMSKFADIFGAVVEGIGKLQLGETEEQKAARLAAERELAERQEQERLAELERRRQEEERQRIAEAKWRRRMINQRANAEIQAWLDGNYQQVMGNYYRQQRQMYQQQQEMMRIGSQWP